MYVKTGKVEGRAIRRRQFQSKYTEQDIGLLAEVDRAHQRLSGPATRCILKREYEKFGKLEFARLAGISTSHLYNLRHSLRYRQQAAVFEPTRPSGVTIGERRRPDPLGRPGFLRVDTVHQGDWDGAKGVYHVNAVDTVTQWQVVGCASKISEQFLMPVLEAMLHQFPFRILGFHADNGSEFINHAVAQMLDKLLVEFTKSRACRSQDNALVEGKNGAVVRKLIGYGHIPTEHAEALQKFYTASLNPYLNFHRPCGFATVSLDARGKRKRQYKPQDYATPHQKLKSLLQAQDYLKEGISLDGLDRLARTMSDTEFARKMSAAKAKLRACKIESPLPPPRFL
jgi:transposase InsO family protein